MNSLWVWVVDANYEPIKEAQLQAVTKSKQRGPNQSEPLEVGREAEDDHWVIHAEQGVTVDIAVEAPGYERVVHTVAARDNVTQVVIGMGRDGELAYNYGDNRLVFEPTDDEFLLSVNGDKSRSLTERALKKAKLKHRPAVTNEDVPGASSTMSDDPDGAFLLVQGDVEQLVEVAKQLTSTNVQARVLRLIRHGERPPLGLSNELVVRFKGEVQRSEANQLANKFDMRITREINHAGNAFLLVGDDKPSYNVLFAANELMASGAVEYVEPDLHHHLELDAYTPNDPLFAQTPYLSLINVDEAWDQLDNVDVNLRGGSPEIAIAVMDGNGVSPTHPDLSANLTDGTSKMVTSMNFRASPIAAQTVAALSGNHGTQCAGSATGAFDNNLGTTGVAPNCHLLGGRTPVGAGSVAMADAYMWMGGFFNGSTAAGFPATLPSQPADVITSSFGATGLLLSNTMRDLFDFLSTYGRNGKGTIVLWSLGNSGFRDFTNPVGTNHRAWPTYNRCLGVGSSINTGPTNPLPTTVFADHLGSSSNVPAVVDTRTLFSPFGATGLRKPDLVCPSHTAYIPGGGIYDPIMAPVRAGTGAINSDYADSFGGTSHSTPATAGAVALILSANPQLNWVQVRDILRQSCVRIDAAQANAIGAWQDLDADGNIDYSRWYGAGRIDVEAAVNLVLDGMLQLSDIYVRENLADDGDVPSGGSWWASPDIWVRENALEAIPALAWGTAAPHQNAVGGQDNAVFARVRNRGTGAATELNLRAMVTHWAGLEFAYPSDFQPSNNVGAPVPNPLVPGTYLIGEATITNLAPGADQIVKFVWPDALVPPEEVVVSGTTVRWHPCLLLEASPHDGPPPIGGLSVPVQGNNNIAQRNITISYTDEDSAAFTGVMVGSRDKAGVATLVIDPRRLDGAKAIRLHLADERLMKRLSVSAERVARQKPRRPLDIFERGFVLENRTLLRMGNGRLGSLLEAAPGSRIAAPFDQRSGFDVSFGSYKGVPVVELSNLREEIELPIRLEAGQFVPLLVSVDGEPGGDLRLTQRRGDGELSGGYGIRFGETRQR